MLKNECSGEGTIERLLFSFVGSTIFVLAQMCET